MTDKLEEREDEEDDDDDGDSQGCCVQHGVQPAREHCFKTVFHTFHLITTVQNHVT